MEKCVEVIGMLRMFMLSRLLSERCDYSCVVQVILH